MKPTLGWRVTCGAHVGPTWGQGVVTCGKLVTHPGGEAILVIASNNRNGLDSHVNLSRKQTYIYQNKTTKTYLKEATMLA